jgi:hypothetical protein
MASNMKNVCSANLSFTMHYLLSKRIQRESDQRQSVRSDCRMKNVMIWESFSRGDSKGAVFGKTPILVKPLGKFGLKPIFVGDWFEKQLHVKPDVFTERSRPVFHVWIPTFLGSSIGKGWSAQGRQEIQSCNLPSSPLAETSTANTPGRRLCIERPTLFLIRVQVSQIPEPSMQLRATMLEL